MQFLNIWLLYTMHVAFVIYLFYCRFFFVLLLVISFLFLFNCWLFTCLQCACFFCLFCLFLFFLGGGGDIDTGDKNYEISMVSKKKLYCDIYCYREIKLLV